MFVYRQDNLEETVHDVVRNTAWSDFYYKKYHLSGQSESFDFLQLPYLLRDELATTPLRERTYCEPRAIRFFGFSSGTTTGTPLISAFGEISSYHVEPSLGMDIKRPLIVYPPLNKNFGASFIQQCREARRPVSPVFGNIEQLANSAVLAGMTDCDSVYATPTIALRLAPYLQQYYDTNKIQLLALASETVTPYIWRQLRTLYPQASISNLYASSEIGQFILYTKPSRDVFPEHFIVMPHTVAALELIDDELVVTYLTNPAFPLIRYKTGDSFKLSEQGENGIPHLIMVGREGVDTIKVGGFELRGRDIDECVEGLPQSFRDYQLHVYEVNESQYRVEFEYVSKTEGDKSMQAILIRSHLVNHFKLSGALSFEAAIVKGILTDFTVSEVAAVSVQGQKRRVVVFHNNLA